MDELILRKADFDQSITELTADSIITRLFFEIEKVSEPEVVDESWLAQLMDVIKFSQDIETGFGHAFYYALYTIKKHWEDLPFELRKQYNYTYMDFARLVTGRESSTILNGISTAQLWFEEKPHPEGTITIAVRDISGRPVVNSMTGEIRTKSVEFSPYLVDMSKLLMVNAKARAGEMTPKLWECLVDDYFTCEDLRQILREKVTPEQEEFYYFVEGPGLFVRDGGRVFCLCEEMTWAEYENDWEHRKAMDKFLTMLGVKLEEIKRGVWTSP